MNYRFDTRVKAYSRFIAEDYFPAIVEFSSEETNNHFIAFHHGDTDLFEFSVHPKTYMLKRFTLTLCNHYEIIDDRMAHPICDEGALYIDGPDSIECETFLLSVYSDGLRINISTAPVENSFRSGNLVFSISNEGELVDVYVCNLSEQAITHVTRELSLQ